MPNIRTETWGAGDQSWLASAHGIGDCRTETIKTSAFNKDAHYPDGYIPSGTAVSKVDGLLVPYDPTDETGNAGDFAGHIFTDQRVVGTVNIPAPLLDHGRVKAEKVPGTFEAPAAQPNTTIVYL